MLPWRNSVTSLLTWRATSVKPSCSKSIRNRAGSGLENSTNSRPATPSGLSLSCGDCAEAAPGREASLFIENHL